MKKAWNKISEIGVFPEMEMVERNSIVFVNRMSAVIFLLAFLSIGINILLKDYNFIPALGSVLLFLLLSYFLHTKRLYIAGKFVVLSTVIALLMYMSFNGGFGSGLEFYFLSLMALPLFIFRDKKMMLSFQAICVFCLVIQKLSAVPPPGFAASAAHQVFYVFNSVGSCSLIILSMIFFKDITNKNEKDLSDKNLLIEDQNKQLVSANRQLDEFAYSVSHDLKAPLRIIDGYASMLEADYGHKMEPEDKKLLKVIRNRTEQMQNLIETMLVFSRSSKKELKTSTVNMSGLANESLKFFQHDIDQYKINVMIDDLPQAKGDRDLLSHVVTNLVSNAVKYSRKKENAKVQVGSYQDGKFNVYFVKDNGAGFSMEYAEKLFTPFSRLHTADEYEGTGVGLAIVQNIILKHGGRVWAEGKVGEGASFYFALPKE